jgi:hypothetical protein
MVGGVNCHKEACSAGTAKKETLILDSGEEKDSLNVIIKYEKEYSLEGGESKRSENYFLSLKYIKKGEKE